MRWTAAVIIFSVIASVSSTEVSDVEDTEPYLHVMARPSVFNAGERRAIFCQGRNLPHAVNWYSPSGNIVSERSNSNNRVYVERKLDRNGVLVPLIIHEVKVEDAGSWTCKAGEYNETIDIIVGIKVKIQERQASVEGKEGKSIKLSCFAKGYPLPNIQWYKDGKSINEKNIGNKYVMKKKGDNYTLEIKNLSYEDVGEYICKVMQKALSYYTDKVFMLSVKHAPVLVTFKTVEVYAAVNTTKNITCSAIANPLPKYEWFRRHGSYDTEISEEDTISTADDGTSSTLLLRIYSGEEIGEYKCKVSNDEGSQTVIFDVSLGDRPIPPDSVSVVESNSTHITFNVTCNSCPIWQNDTMSPDPKNLTVIGFDFLLTPVVEGVPPDWDAGYLFEMNIEEPQVTVFAVGILPNMTQFHARVRTRNLAGESDWFDIHPDPSTSRAVRLFATLTLIIATLISLRY